MQSLTDKLNWYIFSKSPILDPEHAQGCIEYASLEAQTRFGPETLRLVLGAFARAEAPWEPCPDDETTEMDHSHHTCSAECDHV